MVPRPQTPEPHLEAGTIPLDTSNNTLIQPVAGERGSPARRNRRSRGAGGGTASASASGPGPGIEDPLIRYGPSRSLQRHVLSPIGGGRVVRRPVVERSLKKLCTLVLPSLYPTDSEGDQPSSSSSDRNMPRQPSASSLAALAPTSAVDDSDARSTSSRMSHATGTTAPVTNTTVGGSVVTGREQHASGREQQQQHQLQQTVEQSFPPPRANFAPGCQPQIIFGKYIAAATDDGRICLFEVRKFEQNLDLAATTANDAEILPIDNIKTGDDVKDQADEKKEEEDWDEIEKIKELMNEIEDGRDAVEAVATVGPFRVGGGLMSAQRNNDGDDLDDNYPACIVAVTATPAHVPLPLYRRRKKRRKAPSRDTSDNIDDDTLPPPPPSKSGHTFLGHVAILTSEGDVHIIEAHEKDVPGDPSVEVLTSFSSMEYCATSICLRPSPNGDDGDSDENKMPGGPSFRICIGHDNGLIAEFEVVVTVDTPLGGAAGIRRPLLASSKASTPEQTSSLTVRSSSSPSTHFGRDSAHSLQDEKVGEDPARPSTPPSSPTGPSQPTALDMADAVSAAAGALDRMAASHHHSKRRESQTSDDGVDSGGRADTMDSGKPNALGETTTQQEETKSPPPPLSPPLRYSLPRPRLVWAGQLDAPIRSLSSIGGSLTTGDDELITFRRAHLVVGLLQRARLAHDAPISSSPPPSSAIEVVNAQLAEEEWNSTRSGDSGFTLSKGLDPIPLDSFCTWPGVGMEIRDGSMISEIQEGSSDYMAARADKDIVRSDCIASCDGLDSGFTLSMSDGTAAAVHAVKQTDGTGAWGIAHNYNQIFLPGASIGVGFFLGGSDEERMQQYAAYCLQGDLVFVGPIVSPSLDVNKGSSPVLMYQCPYDPEGGGDDAIRFTHGFAAGDIAIRSSVQEEPSGTFPVVAFSWAGGILDVFSCGDYLSSQDDSNFAISRNARDEAIEMLLETGQDAVIALIKKLLSTGEDHDILDDELWQDAWEECRNVFRRSWEEGDEGEGVKDVPTTIIEGMRTPKDDISFANMRKLLWSFVVNM